MAAPDQLSIAVDVEADPTVEPLAGDCPHCHGTGTYNDDMCVNCNGTGNAVIPF